MGMKDEQNCNLGLEIIQNVRSFSNSYFEYLAWDKSIPLNWGEGLRIADLISDQEGQVLAKAAMKIVRQMTDRTFNEGGDNLSEANLALLLETRDGFRQGGDERPWNNPCDEFKSIEVLKANYLYLLKKIGFLTDLKLSDGAYFFVRTYLWKTAPVGHRIFEMITVMPKAVDRSI